MFIQKMVMFYLYIYMLYMYIVYIVCKKNIRRTNIVDNDSVYGRFRLKVIR